MASDEEMQQWIDNLSEHEMRDVLKYLVLLNADAVQNAMRYVQRREAAAEASPLKVPDDEEPPPLRARSGSEDDDEMMLDLPNTPSSSRISRPSSADEDTPVSKSPSPNKPASQASSPAKTPVQQVESPAAKSAQSPAPAPQTPPSTTSPDFSGTSKHND